MRVVFFWQETLSLRKSILAIAEYADGDLQELSAPLGTEIRIRNNVSIIRP